MLRLNLRELKASATTKAKELNLISKVKGLEEGLSSAKKEVAKFQKMSNELKDKTASYMQKTDDLKKKLGEANKQAFDAQAESDQLKDQLKKIAGDHSKKVANLAREILKLNGRNKALSDELNGNERKLLDATSQLEATQAHM